MTVCREARSSPRTNRPKTKDRIECDIFRTIDLPIVGKQAIDHRCEIHLSDEREHKIQTRLITGRVQVNNSR